MGICASLKQRPVVLGLTKCLSNDMSYSTHLFYVIFVNIRCNFFHDGLFSRISEASKPIGSLNLGKPSVTTFQTIFIRQVQTACSHTNQKSSILVVTKMAEKITNLKNKCVLYENSDDDEEDTGDDCGLALDKLNLGPRKKLLVLGLGGLLYHRVYRRVKSNIPVYCRHDASYGSFLGKQNSSLC